MKALIEKIDELMRGYRDHPQTIIFEDLRELRMLVWAEQERIIKELETRRDYEFKQRDECPKWSVLWHTHNMAGHVCEDIQEIVKGE